MLLDELPWRGSNNLGHIEFVDFGMPCGGFYLSRIREGCSSKMYGPRYYADVPTMGIHWRHLDPIEAQCLVFEIEKAITLKVTSATSTHPA